MHKDGEKIKLSISILVSNSMDTIRKCMESLVPILENVASELIIVDTGGTDGSIEVAREYADQVVKFEWCRDFAKARNAGLEKASGEWFMFLDDDEWFEDATEIIEFFNSGEYRKYGFASYHIRNYENYQGTSWQDVRTYRMVKRDKNTRFLSPIHEILQPLPNPEKLLECYLHHYGYVYKSAEEHRKHAFRNISLLKEVLENTPKDYRLWVQLAQEYNSVKELQLSKELSLKVIRQTSGIERMDTYDKKMLGWLLQNIVIMDMAQQDYESAYRDGSEFLTYSWPNHIIKCVLAYRLVGVCDELGKQKEISRYAESYEKNYEALKNRPKLKREENLGDLEDWVTEKQLAEMYVARIRAEHKLEQKEKAAALVKKLVVLKAYDRTSKELEELLEYLLTERKKIAEGLLLYLYKKEKNKKQIALLTEADKWSEMEQRSLYEMLAGISADPKDTLPFRLICSFGTDSFKEKNLEKYLENADNLLEINIEIWKIMDTWKTDVSHYIEKQETVTWTGQVNRFLTAGKEEKAKIILRVMERASVKSYKTELLKMRCLEKLMLSEKIKETDTEQVKAMGEAYSSTAIFVFSHWYKEESFENEFCAFLPVECRFAAGLRDLLNKELADPEKIEKIRELTEIYPKMAEFCKRFALEMKEEMRQRDQVSEEFSRLAQGVKEKIYSLLKEGNVLAAKQIFMQLKQLVPVDEELEKIEGLLMAGESQSEL